MKWLLGAFTLVLLLWLAGVMVTAYDQPKMWKCPDDTKKPCVPPDQGTLAAK